MTVGQGPPAGAHDQKPPSQAGPRQAAKKRKTLSFPSRCVRTMASHKRKKICPDSTRQDLPKGNLFCENEQTVVLQTMCTRELKLLLGTRTPPVEYAIRTTIYTIVGVFFGGAQNQAWCVALGRQAKFEPNQLSHGPLVRFPIPCTFFQL